MTERGFRPVDSRSLQPSRPACIGRTCRHAAIFARLSRLCWYEQSMSTARDEERYSASERARAAGSRRIPKPLAARRPNSDRESVSGYVRDLERVVDEVLPRRTPALRILGQKHAAGVTGCLQYLTVG